MDQERWRKLEEKRVRRNCCSFHQGESFVWKSLHLSRFVRTLSFWILLQAIIIIFHSGIIVWIFPLFFFDILARGSTVEQLEKERFTLLLTLKTKRKINKQSKYWKFKHVDSVEYKVEKLSLAHYRNALCRYVRQRRRYRYAISLCVPLHYPKPSQVRVYFIGWILEFSGWRKCFKEWEKFVTYSQTSSLFYYVLAEHAAMYAN